MVAPARRAARAGPPPAATPLKANGSAGSTESSPTKGLLPPKTPAPAVAEHAQPPGLQSPPSALSQGLQRSGSVPALGPAAAGSSGGPGQPLWAGLASAAQGGGGSEPGPAAAAAAAADADELLLPPPAAAAAAQNMHLSVHSAGGGTAGELGLGLAAAAAGVVAAAAAAAAGETGEEAVTPRLLAAPAGALDIMSPSSEGFSLADLLQARWRGPGPAPPPPHTSLLSSSPGGGALGLLPDLAQASPLAAALSPRRSLQLPGCSPLPPSMARLRDPPHLPGMPPLAPLVPRPPVPPAPLAPGALQAGGLRPLRPLLPGGLPPQWRPPGAQQPLAGLSPPPGLLPKPLGQPLPLMRPEAGPLLKPPPGAASVLSAPVGQAAPGALVMVPVPSADEDEFLTAEGVRRVAAAAPALGPEAEPQAEPQQGADGGSSSAAVAAAAKAAAGAAAGALPAAGAAQQQQQQQQQQQGRRTQSAADGDGGTAVPLVPVAAIPSPAAAAAFASIQTQAAAGAAAAAAAILAAPAAAAGAAGAPAAAAGHAPAAAQRDPLRSPAFRALLAMIRGNSQEFEAQGRVLRLRQFLRADAPPAALDAVLAALEHNTRVQALYCHNFEQGFLDPQLDRLARLLRLGRIWAVNVGENFGTTQQAWRRFADALPHTAVAHLFVSEQHLAGTDLKARMREAIRANRRAAPPRDPEVIVHVGNMWWNPRLPPAAYSPSPASTAAAAAAGAAAVVTVPAARPPPACRGDSGGGSTRAGSGGSAAGAGGSAAEPGDAGSAGPASGASEAAEAPATAAAAAQQAVAQPVQQQAQAQQQQQQQVEAQQQQAQQQPPLQQVQQAAGGLSQEVAPALKRQLDTPEGEQASDSPPAKRGPGVSAFAAAAAEPMDSEAVPAPADDSAAAAGPEAGTPPEADPAAAAAAETAAAAAVAPAAAPASAAPAAGRGRRAARPSAARLLQQQQSDYFSSDEEVDEAYLEGDAEDASYLPFKSGALAALDPRAAPTRASQRLQRRSLQAYQGHRPGDSEFVTFDPRQDEEPAAPGGGRRPRGGAAATRQQAQQVQQAAQQQQQQQQALTPAATPASGAGAPRAGKAGAPRAAAAAAKRTMAAAAQRLRSAGSSGGSGSSTARQASGDLKGRPSFAELVESGFMAPGPYCFTVGMQDIQAVLEADGTILYGGVRYRAISKFALVILRAKNPARQSCDGWKEVALNGEKLDVLRARFQSHQRRAAARRAGAPG